MDGQGLLRLEEAAEHFAVSPHTIRKWVQKGLLRQTKVPGSNLCYFTREDLEARKTGASPEAAPTASPAAAPTNTFTEIEQAAETAITGLLDFVEGATAPGMPPPPAQPKRAAEPRTVRAPQPAAPTSTPTATPTPRRPPAQERPQERAQRAQEARQEPDELDRWLWGTPDRKQKDGVLEELDAFFDELFA